MGLRESYFDAFIKASEEITALLTPLEQIAAGVDNPQEVARAALHDHDERGRERPSPS